MYSTCSRYWGQKELPQRLFHPFERRLKEFMRVAFRINTFWFLMKVEIAFIVLVNMYIKTDISVAIVLSSQAGYSPLNIYKGLCLHGPYSRFLPYRFQMCAIRSYTVRHLPQVFILWPQKEWIVTSSLSYLVLKEFLLMYNT